MADVGKIKVVQRHSVMAGTWCASWLFTVGFLHLGFWKIVLAFVIWPYYLGGRVSELVH